PDVCGKCISGDCAPSGEKPGFQRSRFEIAERCRIGKIRLMHMPVGSVESTLGGGCGKIHSRRLADTNSRQWRIISRLGSQDQAGTRDETGEEEALNCLCRHGIAGSGLARRGSGGAALSGRYLNVLRGKQPHRLSARCSVRNSFCRASRYSLRFPWVNPPGLRCAWPLRLSHLEAKWYWPA